ncbi:MAG TPA: YbhB/YbcL family Raf kinase inhibitor-like protein [Sedimentisphaerales bacterium]
MKLWSDSFSSNSYIPGKLAFCISDSNTHTTLSDNCNPHLAWSDVPTGTQSLVVICHDRDVPSKGDDVNQEGRTVPADLPRVDFFHWTLIDLPADLKSIAECEFSNTVTACGKPGPASAYGSRQGINDYSPWFANDPEMAGDYFGYDGPCPPWNDSIMHHYVFTLFALDIPRLPLDGKFIGQQVRDAMKGHILAEAAITGTYTLNPAIK